MVKRCSNSVPWFVYIVECNDSTYYTGVTVNLKNRIETHNKGLGAKYTRSRLPVKLLASTEVIGQSAALKLEASIKKQPRSKKVEMLLNGTD